jgi:hypothetical protein
MKYGVFGEILIIAALFPNSGEFPKIDIKNPDPPKSRKMIKKIPPKWKLNKNYRFIPIPYQRPKM